MATPMAVIDLLAILPFTHIAHELKHEKTNSELPPNMQLGHDGQVINL